MAWETTAADLVLSILFAYPLSGAIYAVNVAIHSPYWHGIDQALNFVAMWMLLVPAAGGLVPADFNSGPIINMYPWIVPTAGVLFFCFSKGWRWFRRTGRAVP